MSCNFRMFPRKFLIVFFVEIFEYFVSRNLHFFVKQIIMRNFAKIFAFIVSERNAKSSAKRFILFAGNPTYNMNSRDPLFLDLHARFTMLPFGEPSSMRTIQNVLQTELRYKARTISFSWNLEYNMSTNCYKTIR